MGNPIQTIPNLPPAISLDGTEQMWINQAGVDRRVTIAAALQPGPPPLPPLPTLVGLFSFIPFLLIPHGVDLIQTSGYSVVGIGVARYTTDPDQLTPTPNAGRVRSLNGRWFKLTETFPTFDMFGALAGVTNTGQDNNAPGGPTPFILNNAVAWIHTYQGGGDLYVPANHGLYYYASTPILMMDSVRFKGFGRGYIPHADVVSAIYSGVTAPFTAAITSANQTVTLEEVRIENLEIVAPGCTYAVIDTAAWSDFVLRDLNIFGNSAAFCTGIAAGGNIATPITAGSWSAAGGGQLTFNVGANLTSPNPVLVGGNFTVVGCSPAGYNGASTAGGIQSISLTTANITAASWAAGQITYTTSVSLVGLVVPGAVLPVTGCAPALYNGSFVVVSVSPTQVVVSQLTNPGAFVSGGSIAITTVVFTQGVPGNPGAFVSGGIALAGPGATVGHNLIEFCYFGFCDIGVSLTDFATSFTVRRIRSQPKTGGTGIRIGSPYVGYPNQCSFEDNIIETGAGGVTGVALLGAPSGLTLISGRFELPAGSGGASKGIVVSNPGPLTVTGAAWNATGLGQITYSVLSASPVGGYFVGQQVLVQSALPAGYAGLFSFASAAALTAVVSGATWVAGQITFTVGTNLTASLFPGMAVLVTGNSPVGYNGLWTVVSVSATQIVTTGPPVTNPGAWVSGGAVASNALTVVAPTNPGAFVGGGTVLGTGNNGGGVGGNITLLNNYYSGLATLLQDPGNLCVGVDPALPYMRALIVGSTGVVGASSGNVTCTHVAGSGIYVLTYPTLPSLLNITPHLDVVAPSPMFAVLHSNIGVTSTTIQTYTSAGAAGDPTTLFVKFN